MNISDFFKQDLVNYVVYDNVRKIASLVDGLKNSSRKVVYTALKKNITHSKVQNVSSTVSIETQYIHGSLDGVVVSLCKDYVGSNQLPLLKGFGNFGSRDNHEASASRYISCGVQPYLDGIFIKDELVEPQMFEGDEIEPKFLLPVIPLLLVNGSNGLSTGYKQTILPRKLSDVIKITIETIKDRSKAVKIDELTPYIKGYNGTIEKVDNSYVIKGVYEVKGNTINISELPYNIETLKYINLLDSLVDSGDILSYEDKSNDNICFTVVVDKVTDKIIKKLKLEERVSETLTAVDENNNVLSFDKLSQILTKYVDIRLGYVEQRRLKKINDIILLLEITKSILKFINANVDLRHKTDQQVLEIFENLNLVKHDNYKYILNLRVSDFSKQQQYEQKIDKLTEQLEYYKNLTSEDLWISEIRDVVTRLV